jgi:hypothetical protein
MDNLITLNRLIRDNIEKLVEAIINDMESFECSNKQDDIYYVNHLNEIRKKYLTNYV